MLREEVFMALANFDHKETHEELKKRFQTYLNDKNTAVFPVDIRKVNINSHNYSCIMKVLFILKCEYQLIEAFLFPSGCLHFYNENFKFS